MGRICRTHGKKDAYELFLGKPEGKGLLGRSRRRLEDNIKVTDDKLIPALMVKLQWSQYYILCGVEW